MYPKLTDFINAWLGTSFDLPVQTYGFFVALAFLAAGFLLYLELRRKEREGFLQPRKKEVLVGNPATLSELIISFLMAFVVFYKLVGIITEYGHFRSDPQGYLFSITGSWMGGLLAGLLFAFVTWYQKHRKRIEKPEKQMVLVHPRQLTGNILIIAALSGIAGAKLFDVIEHLDELFHDPVGTLFSFSGLAFYGGLIVATLVVGWYGERNRIPWPSMGDSVAPGLILAYGIGRIGCQAAGDGCWGMANPHPKPDWLGFLPDWMWSFDYPHNVINEGVLIPGCAGEHCHILDQAVYPTPFYETMMALVIFFILWSIRKKIKIPGILFAIYFILNGTERFLIEKIRINIEYNLLGMKVTQAEVIAVGLIILGVAGIFYFLKRNKKKEETSTYETG